MLRIYFQRHRKEATMIKLKIVHLVSEVPRNGNGNILALSDSETKLYNMNELMDKTNCTTYNEMWEQEVKKYHLKCWLFVKDFIESVMKGGNND